MNDNSEYYSSRNVIVNQLGETNMQHPTSHSSTNANYSANNTNHNTNHNNLNKQHYATSSSTSQINHHNIQTKIQNLTAASLTQQQQAHKSKTTNYSTTNMNTYNSTSSAHNYMPNFQNSSRLEYMLEQDRQLMDLNNEMEKEPILNQKSKDRVNKVLANMEQLTEMERLYLYFKMPTGNEIKGNRSNRSQTTAEAEALKKAGKSGAGDLKDSESLNTNAMQTKPNHKLQPIQDHDQCCVLTHHKRSVEKLAGQWISDQLELCEDTSLARKDVYEDYLRYTQQLKCDHLVQSDFGKIMRQIFPEVQSRRLGSRGASKYCYSGLRKRTDNQEPSLVAGWRFSRIMRNYSTLKCKFIKSEVYHKPENSHLFLITLTWTLRKTCTKN